MVRFCLWPSPRSFFFNTLCHLHLVRNSAAVLLFTVYDTLNCMHCHGKQHSDCMEKSSSPLLQKWRSQRGRSTILKPAKNLRSIFKARGGSAPLQHSMCFISNSLEHHIQPGDSLERGMVSPLFCRLTMNCELSARSGTEGTSMWLLSHGLDFSLCKDNTATSVPETVLQVSVTLVSCPICP